MTDLMHTLSEAAITTFATTLTIAGGLWLARRGEKKEREEHQERTEFLLREYGLHDHVDIGDDDTVLTKGGIRRPKVNGK